VKRFIALAAFLFVVVSFPAVDGQAPAHKAAFKYARGRKVDPAKSKALFVAHHTEERIKHLKRLPRATQPKYDTRAIATTTGTVSWVPPVVDQGQCGSCWDFSGTCVCTCAFLKAMGPSSYPGPLSEQYTLDCGQNGGCNGDDNTTVMIWAKATGLPTTAQYGPYKGSAGSCKSGTTLYKITDWGYVTTGNNQAVAATQDIKNAMQAYGPIGCGVAAGSTWDNYTTGLLSGAPSTDINHDVVLVGWDDTQGPSGVWIMRNSWANTWGQPCGGTEGGYAYVPYGDFDLGWEAVWGSVAAPTPPPTPPTPPGPVPPVPPVPGQAPVINSALTASAVVGQPFTYQITATNSPDTLIADGLPAGLTSTNTGTVSGTPTMAGVFNVTLAAFNPLPTNATLVLTVTSTPVNPITITLTADQAEAISAIAAQIPGNIRVTPNMSARELAALLDKCLLPVEVTAVAPAKVDDVRKDINELKAVLEGLLQREIDRMKQTKEPPLAPKESPKKVSLNHGGFYAVFVSAVSLPGFGPFWWSSGPGSQIEGTSGFDGGTRGRREHFEAGRSRTES
jgi:Papain family cysteine protease